MFQLGVLIDQAEAQQRSLITGLAMSILASTPIQRYWLKDEEHIDLSPGCVIHKFLLQWAF